MSTGDVLAGMLIGQSRPMRELREVIIAVARVREPILIQGPTGTGKELVVEAVHLLSGRAGKLTVVNTPAIPESTFESTFFGHTRGAFTGAVGELPGLVAEARAGTLFLDEIGTFPLALQPKLLRVTESMCYRPVGAGEDNQGDFRLVSASNEDLEARVLEGTFRADLLERIGVVRIDVLPLRDRLQDVPMLIDHFVKQAVAEGHAQVSFADDAMNLLMAYHWPRNVRQLKNLVLRAAILKRPVVQRRHVEPLLTDASVPQSIVPAENGERGRLVALLEAAEWNVDVVAHALNVSRATVYRTMHRYGIKRPAAIDRGLADIGDDKTVGNLLGSSGTNAVAMGGR